MEQNDLSLLGLALRGGLLAVGDDAVEDAVKRKEARLLLLASDASNHIRRTAERLSETSGCPLAVLPCSRETLGGVLGRSSAAVAALTDIGLAASLVKRLAAQDEAAFGDLSAVLNLKAKRANERREVRRQQKRENKSGRQPGKQAAGKREYEKREYGKQAAEKREYGKQASGKREYGKQASGKREYGKQASGKREYGKQASGKREFGKQAPGKREFGKQASGKWEHGKRLAHERGPTAVQPRGKRFETGQSGTRGFHKSGTSPDTGGRRPGPGVGSRFTREARDNAAPKGRLSAPGAGSRPTWEARDKAAPKGRCPAPGAGSRSKGFQARGRPGKGNRSR